MPSDLISLDEASWRLEQSGISGRAFAELLLETEPLLLGFLPGKELPRLVDLSRVTRVEAQPENEVVAGDITFTVIKLSSRQLVAAFEKRGLRARKPFRIAPELLQRSSQPDPSRRLLGDPRPPVPLMAFMRPAPEAQPSPRRASQEWFVATAYTGLVPVSGKPPLGKRGPKSGKRENAAAAIRQDLSEEVLTVESLSAMPEKQLAHRYGVSRDTVRKARHDVLAVAISTSPNDK